ncbi:MAG: M56 family metallopeptidase [Candidatus Sumerlaeaceae bacterium]
MNAEWVNSIVHAIGWSLLHLLWQAAGIAALLSVCLFLLAGKSANLRYLVCCSALFIISVLPVANLLWLTGSNFPGAPDTVLQQASRSILTGPEETLAPVPISNASSLPQSTTQKTTGFALSRNSTVQPAPGIRLAETLSAKVRLALDRHIAGLVAIWSIGSALLALRLFGGWLLLRRSCARSNLLAGAEIEEAFIRLAAALQIRQRVRIFLSPHGNAPISFGLLKPIILFPATLLSGLPAPEIEALLAHELAHIRRHDYVVNLLQAVAETLFYYHPAVWWISARIREERELCCDHLAAGACTGGAPSLARALARMEQRRTSFGDLTLAASGSPLLLRIRRLVTDSNLNSSARGGRAGGVLFAGGIAVAAMLMVLHATAQMAPLDGSPLPGIPPSDPNAPATSVAPQLPLNSSAVSGAAPAPVSALSLPPLRPAAPAALSPMALPGASGGPPAPAPGMAAPVSPGFPEAQMPFGPVPGMEAAVPGPDGKAGPSPATVSRVFNLAQSVGGQPSSEAVSRQIAAQIQKLLYPGKVQANETPDRRFWYDSEAGLLTILDYPQQLEKVANFLRQPRIRAVLQQDEGDTTAVERVLTKGDTMRFGDVAMRLEDIRQKTDVPESVGQVELLVRTGPMAEVHVLEELSSLQVQGCTISVVELTKLNELGSSRPAALLEMRMPKSGTSQPPMASLAQRNLSPPQPAESQPRVYTLYREFETLLGAGSHEAAREKLEDVRRLAPADRQLLAKIQRLDKAEGKGGFSVRVGGALQKQAADTLAGELKMEGYKTVEVTPTKDGKFEVRCGQMRTEREGQMLMKDLKTAGFTPEGILSSGYNPEAMPPVPVEAAGSKADEL